MAVDEQRRQAHAGHAPTWAGTGCLPRLASGAVSSDRFGGLQPHIFLAIGARVFINNNVWVSAGLTNGAVGKVVHMQWAVYQAPPQLPEVVWVRVENYWGPQYFEQPLRATAKLSSQTSAPSPPWTPRMVNHPQVVEEVTGLRTTPPAPAASGCTCP
ncbi:unnamed protein product [Ectocarpus fasciculatus]